MKIALHQLDIHDGEPSANLQAALAALEANPGADLHLFPELWSTGYAHARWASAADTETPIILDRLQAHCDAHGCGIGGSLISRNEEGALVNRFWLLDAGAPRVCYDKVHLFEPLDEHVHLARGGRTGLLPFRGEQIHVSICFDLRFPEMYRQAAVQGVRLFLVASEWPEPRQRILSALAGARAMENQAFLALCNRVGPASGGLKFPGQSAVYAPDGIARVFADENRSCFVAEVDLEDADRLRAALPVLDRRIPGLDY